MGRGLRLRSAALARTGRGVADPQITLAAIVGATERIRLGRETSDGAAEPFDIAVELDPGSDPAPYAAAGATWGLVAFPWNPVSVDQVRGVIREGPPPVPQGSSSRV